MRARWTRLAFALGLLILIGLWWGWRVYNRKQGEKLMAIAREEMSHNRWRTARAALTEVLNRRPGWDEAVYELGVCELAGGRVRGDRGLGKGS